MNMRITRSLRPFLLVPALAPVAGPALAQEGGTQEEIVVVGTRGEGRSALDSPVPVDVISAADIARVESLGGELGELLQALAPSFNFPRQSNSGAADHVRAAQLRGMNPDHVLVLVNGKLTAIWHASDTIALRGALGSSFRAPSLVQTGFESSTINFGDGGMLEQFRHLPVSHPDAIASGATPLEDEESVNASIGLVITPADLFSVTIDYFQIDVDDRVSFISAPNNITYFANRVDTETTGFDVVATGDLDLGGGALSWQLGYNRSETDVKNPSVLAPRT